MAGEKLRRQYSTHITAVDAKISELVSSFKDSYDRRLLTEMVTTVYRLGEAGTPTGDLKLLNSAYKELRYALKVFRAYRRTRKVAMFGSARLPKRHPLYAIAQKFGKLMANEGWMVITGGASGIMKAGHEGAGRDASFGLNIRLPFEQVANPVIAKDAKLVNCKYFFTRKLLFMKESHATALFPGGFGTLDEGFETLTLVQTGKADPRPVVLIDSPGGSYWKGFLEFFEKQLIRRQMISPSDRATYQVARSAEQAVEIISQFYSTYHSARYVGAKLVLRLQHPLPEGAAARLTREFRDLLTTGSIRQGKALAEELDEPELRNLPRLILRFNRREYGRLIQLIHRVNELGLKASKR